MKINLPFEEDLHVKEKTNEKSLNVVWLWPSMVVTNLWRPVLKGGRDSGGRLAERSISEEPLLYLCD